MVFIATTILSCRVCIQLMHCDARVVLQTAVNKSCSIRIMTPHTPIIIIIMKSTSSNSQLKGGFLGYLLSTEGLYSINNMHYIYMCRLSITSFANSIVANVFYT